MYFHKIAWDVTGNGSLTPEAENMFRKKSLYEPNKNMTFHKSRKLYKILHSHTDVNNL